MFVFDRRSGEPIWPIEERAVPQSDVPGEYTSPTQPFPTKPAPFAAQSFTARDINPFLPENEREILKQKLRTVVATTVCSRRRASRAPSACPGTTAVRTGRSSAVDPINGELYIVSKNLPVMLRVERSDEEPSARVVNGPVVSAEQAAAALAEAKAAAAKGPVRYVVPYDFIRSPTNGMAAIGPPWSHITAYDLNTGEIKWRVPDGSTTGPGIGADSGAHFARGAPLVTAGGLVFVATAQDRRLRAYDRDTGEVLWSKELPGGSEGIPATYEIDGRQYLALPVAAGAGLFAPTFGGRRRPTPTALTSCSRCRAADSSLGRSRAYAARGSYTPRPATSAIVNPTTSAAASSSASCFSTSSPGHGCSAYQSSQTGAWPTSQPSTPIFSPRTSARARERQAREDQDEPDDEAQMRDLCQRDRRA